MQRLRLAAQIGAGLTGVLYVLDEPTIGLHGRDTGGSSKAMRALVDRGASVVVVEHDAEVIRARLWSTSGPAAARAGGRVVGNGPAAEVLAGDGPTARALRVADGRGGGSRPVKGATWLTVKGARGTTSSDDGALPAGALRVRGGRVGRGQEHAGGEDPAARGAQKLKLTTDEPARVPGHRRVGGAQARRGHRPVAHRAHAALGARRPTWASGTRCVSSSRMPEARARGGASGASRSTRPRSRAAGAARPATARA
jgi:hypothetical protein